jgi:hypothetical protein
LPERIRDLGDLVNPIDQSSKLFLGSITRHFYLVAYLLRDRRLAYEVPTNLHPYATQFYASCPSVAEEVIGDAPCDREVQKLPAVGDLANTHAAPARTGPSSLAHIRF